VYDDLHNNCCMEQAIDLRRIYIIDSRKGIASGRTLMIGPACDGSHYQWIDLTAKEFPAS